MTEEITMGTLLKTKTKLKLDKDLRKLLVRGSRHEILLDLDGDKQADVALIDENTDGDIDTIAVDLTGDGEFDLYFVDTDHNGVPDAVFYYEAGSEEVTVLGLGEEVEEAMIAAAADLYMLMLADEYIAESVDAALEELEKDVRDARKALKKR